MKKNNKKMILKRLKKIHEECSLVCDNYDAVDKLISDLENGDVHDQLRKEFKQD